MGVVLKALNKLDIFMKDMFVLAKEAESLVKGDEIMCDALPAVLFGISNPFKSFCL